jgi:putative nucleotidyltransferase with HDIG domain
LAHFNRHAVAVALLSDLIAMEVDVEYPEGAFTAGLLHDIGKLLIAVSFPSEFLDIDNLTGADWEKETGFEELILGVRHADLSAAALERWNLPAPIREAVAGHHDALGTGRIRLSGVVTWPMPQPTRSAMGVAPPWLPRTMPPKSSPRRCRRNGPRRCWPSSAAPSAPSASSSSPSGSRPAPLPASRQVDLVKSPPV